MSAPLTQPTPTQQPQPIRPNSSPSPDPEEEALNTSSTLKSSTSPPEVEAALEEAEEMDVDVTEDPLPNQQQQQQKQREKKKARQQERIVEEGEKGKGAAEEGDEDETRVALYRDVLGKQMKAFDVKREAEGPVNEFEDGHKAFSQELIEEFLLITLEIDIWANTRISKLKAKHSKLLGDQIASVQAEEDKQERTRQKLIQFLAEVQHALLALDNLTPLTPNKAARGEQGRSV